MTEIERHNFILLPRAVIIRGIYTLLLCTVVSQARHIYLALF